MCAAAGEDEAPPGGMPAGYSPAPADSAAHLSRAFHTSPAAIMVFDACRDGTARIFDFCCVLANPAAGILFGRPLATLLGGRLSEQLTAAVTEGLLDRWIEVVESGTPLRMELRHQVDQEERWLDMAAVQQGDGVLVNMTDISLQKEAEQRLRFAERRLHRILDSALDGIVTLDTAFRISSFNKSAESLFGYSAGTMVGKPLDSLLPPEQRARHAGLVAQFAAGPDRSRRMSEWRLVRGIHRDGHRIPLLASISKISVDGIVTLTVFLRDMTATLRHEDELQAKIDDLREQRRRAEQSSFAKSEFLAKVSHELRTPLNAILGFSEIMQTGLLGQVEPPAYRSYVADIHAGGRHLLELIDDILDLSRIESHKVSLHREPIDLAGELAEALRLIEVERNRRDIAIHSALQGDIGPVTADRRAVQQILLNLLSNAVRYVQQGGWVEVSAERDDRIVTLQVRDNGPGISRLVVQNLGQPFVTAGSIYSDTHSGTGLGLAIVKGLAEAHGGELAVRSDGNGSTVTVSLPQ